MRRAVEGASPYSGVGACVGADAPGGGASDAENDFTGEAGQYILKDKQNSGAFAAEGDCLCNIGRTERETS